MRVLILLFLSAVVTQGALAQTSSPDLIPPDVVIANSDFSTVTYVYGDRRSLSGYAVELPARAEDRFEPGFSPGFNRVTADQWRRSVAYAVLNVFNRGAKTIKVIEWDFSYPRVVNHRAVLRHGARSKVKIAPGETKTLRTTLPKNRRPLCGPVVIILGVIQPSLSGNPDCNVLNSMSVNQHQERVSIKRVEYTDGSVWQRP